MFDYEPYYIHAKDQDKRLFNTRYTRKPNDPLSVTNLGPDDVDYEMQKGKSRDMIEICGITQEGFEHFCRKYGRTYRCIRLFKCQHISDFSPLGDLPDLEYVDVYWNIRSEKLWDMSRNMSLKALHISDCKKITYDPQLLRTAPVLEDIIFCGQADGTYPMKAWNLLQIFPRSAI